MNLGKRFVNKVKERISDPVFDRPLSELNRDYSQSGNITLVTKIKPSYAKQQI